MTYWIDAVSWLLIAVALSYTAVRVIQTLPLPLHVRPARWRRRR